MIATANGHVTLVECAQGTSSDPVATVDVVAAITDIDTGLGQLKR